MEFTKEQLIAKLQHRLAVAATYPDVEEAELDAAIFKIALASLEAEPVSEFYHEASWGWYEISEGDKVPERSRIPLYRVPPAPISVPDDVSGSLAHAYKELTPTFMRNHIDVFERYGIYPDGSAGIQAMRIALDGMSRRAAMLQGADGNSPDGWVACSEQLPPEGYEPDGGAVCYLVWQKNEVDCGPQYSISNVFFLRKHWERNFTHWMPLPAAPQQEDL